MTAFDLDIRFILAFLAPSIAFVFWMVQRRFEDQRKQRDSLREKNNLIRALYAEIDFNTADMEVFLDKSPPSSVIRAALEKNVNLVPHVTDARHTVFYSNLIEDLWVISDHLMAKIVLFYGLLEKNRIQVEGLNLPSYKTLSTAGRFNAVDVIRRTLLDAWFAGHDLLQALEREYPELALERHLRLQDEGIIELKQRQIALDNRMSTLKR